MSSRKRLPGNTLAVGTPAWGRLQLAASALVILAVVTSVSGGQFLAQLTSDYLLYPGALPWWRIHALYYVLDWMATVVLVVPIVLAAIAHAGGERYARTALLMFGCLGLAANAVASLSHLLLWLTQVPARPPSTRLVIDGVLASLLGLAQGALVVTAWRETPRA